MGELIAALVTLLVPAVDRCTALSALDVVRAEAWQAADDELLASLYIEGAGRTDVARLREWRARGVAVQGMRTVRSTCRTAGATSVEVVERLVPGDAVLADGTRRALPRGGWDRRLVDLNVVAGRWRVVSVS